MQPLHSRLARRLALPALVLSMLAAAAGAAAQAFPARPITVVVSFAPGGSVDALTRIVAQHMARTLGQPVVLENVPGAGGTIGSAKVARAAPDGYSIVAGSSGSHAGAYSAYEKMPYAPGSFANLGIIAIIPALVVVKKDLPVNNLQELVAWSKANPGKLAFGHPGVGSSVHLQCEFLKLATGIDMKLVAYKGASPLRADLMGGHIDGGCDAPPSSSGPVQSGQIRASAVMGAERAASMPGVPTTVEQRLPELQAPAWVGLFAPKATPRPVLEALEKAVTLALDDPDVQARITRLGANVPERHQRGSQYADKYVPAEIVKWSELAKAAGIVKQ